MLRPAVLVLIAAPAVALALTGRGPATRPPATVLALAPSLSVEECVEVEAGDTFTVAISAAGVADLLAWDIYYAYDRKILEVVGRDVRQFLDKEPNSNVFDFSDALPNTNGVYHTGAADTGGPGTEEDGSGVLAVLTLRARAEGVSWSSLVRLDTDGDGAFDYGPVLSGTGGSHVGDTNGDLVFDGALRGGQIAVGRSCKEPAPTPYVPPDVVIVPAGNTPVVATATPAATRPEGGTPEPSTTAEASPAADAGSTRFPSRSPSPTVRPAVNPGDGGGDSGSGLSPLLAGLLGAGGGAGIIASYLILRAVRRPA